MMKILFSLLLCSVLFAQKSNNYSLFFESANSEYIDWQTPGEFYAGLGTGDYSICYWIKKVDSSQTSGPLWIRVDGSNYSWLAVLNTGAINHRTAVGGTNKIYFVTSTITSLNTGWNLIHVAVDRDNAANSFLYCNGTKITSYSTRTVSTDDITYATGQSRAMEYNGTYYDGYIDEVAIFNVVHTETDHDRIYNAGYLTDLTNETGLTYWYRFEEGSGTTTNDAVNDSVSTLVNTPTWESTTKLDFLGGALNMKTALGRISISNNVISVWSDTVQVFVQ